MSVSIKSIRRRRIEKALSDMNWMPAGTITTINLRANAPCLKSPMKVVARNDFDAFVAGMASCIDLSGSTSVRYRPCDDVESFDVDLAALLMDWDIVSGDFRTALRELKRELSRRERSGQEALFDPDEVTSKR